MIPLGTTVKMSDGIIGVVSDWVDPPLIAVNCRDGTHRMTIREHVTICHFRRDF